MRQILVWVAVVAAFTSIAVGLQAFRMQLPPAERGRRLAEQLGCFGCHGEGGIEGAANPGRKDRSVPTFGGDLMMYAKTREQVVEWIRDGVTQSRRTSASWQAERDRGSLRMPAYGKALTLPEIEELVAFVMATAGEPEPEDSLVAAGGKRADGLGCTGCHGPGGRFARPNPGSLKGYIPSWDGADFPELVLDRSEFEEWVGRGVSGRFERNPAAGFFLKRAAVHMPAFKSHLEPGDLDALWAYVRWLRSQPKPAPAGR